jgi:hypothetical protein
MGHTKVGTGRTFSATRNCQSDSDALPSATPRDILNNVTKINRNQEDRSAPGKC